SFVLYVAVGDQTSFHAKPVRSHVYRSSPAGQVCFGPIFRRTFTSPMLVWIDVMQVRAVVCCACAGEGSIAAASSAIGRSRSQSFRRRIVVALRTRGFPDSFIGSATARP